MRARLPASVLFFSECGDMDGVPFVSLRVCGQDAPFHEFEPGFLHPVDQFIRRGSVYPAETVCQFFLVLLFGVIRSVLTYIDQVPALVE